MDVKQIRNILNIAEEGSISKAAEKLFITQSALNQQLLKLEHELGVELFTRNGRGVVPTYAGQIYLENARKILDIRNETYKILHDISNVKRGEIRIAYTPERGSRTFSAIYPRFHEKYPEITFKIFEERIVRMTQLLERRQVSIAMLGYYEKPNPMFNYHVVHRERIVLGLPINHPLAHLAGERSWETLPKIDLKLLEHDYFVFMTHETLMRHMVDAMFAEIGVVPQILFESTSTSTVVNMVRGQVAPAFFPQSYVEPDAPIAYFSMDDKYFWHLGLATHKDAYLNQAEKDFIEIYEKIGGIRN